MNNSSWTPPWASRARGSAGIWFLSREDAVELHSDLAEQYIADVGTRVSSWLEGWRFARGPELDDISAEFLYLVLGSGAAGRRDTDFLNGDLVIEVGFGGEPKSPPDCVEIPLRDLIGAAVERLRTL